MRTKASLLLRLAVLFAMTLGVVSMTGMSASAQASTVNCNGILEDGTIIQGDCQVELVEETGACQVTLPDGTIAQGQNDSACEALEANTCPSQVVLEDGSILQITCDEDEAPAPTETPVTPDATETPVTPDATETPVTPDATEEPSTLPTTGAGSTASETGSSAILSVMSVLLMLAGGLIWRRRLA